MLNITERIELENKVKNFLKEYAKPSLEGYATLELPKINNKQELNYIVIIEWQEGFDPSEAVNNPFIDNEGYGLDISIRVDKGMYFRNDNPYPVISENEEYLLTGYNPTSVEQLDEIGDWIVTDYTLAIQKEKYSIKAYNK